MGSTTLSPMRRARKALRNRPTPMSSTPLMMISASWALREALEMSTATQPRTLGTLVSGSFSTPTISLS